MLLLSITIFCALALIYIITRKDPNALFKNAFNNLKMPVCLIDKQNKIIWQNQVFHHEFHIQHNVLFDDAFSPKHILDQMQVSNANGSWALKHVKISHGFGIIFQPMKKESINWWESIPFPIGILNEKNEIEECNVSLKNILSHNVINKSILDFAPQFNMKQAQQVAGQELVWHCKMGILPVVTWIKPYGDKKLLILENRAEFIKMKNKAQEAQHLQIMGQLACSIIHDFNNLLTAISGFSEALQDSMPKNELIAEIKRNTEQAADLAKELLNFVKRKPSEHQTCELATFLKSRVTMLQKLLGSRIKLEIKAEHDGWVELSQTQLEQIILNMAINSKDAMGYTLNEDGEYQPDDKMKVNSFTITQSKKKIAQKVKINGTQIEPGDYFIIEIADTGKGIKKENIAKIFSPFFTTKQKGTGLGLASCLRIIQHAGGTIDFITGELGTKFIIYLPIVDANKKDPAVAEIQPATKKKTLAQKMQETDTRKINIMLVEDEEVIRNLAQKALVQEGYNVYAYASGNEALDAMIKNPNINILITDAVLPGIDGIVLAGKVQQLNAKTRTLVVSGYSYQDLAPNMAANLPNPKMAEYLGKPFTLKILKEKVAQLLV